MSILTLQFGQCGNQVGQSLYSTLEEDISLRNNEGAKSQLYLQYLNKWFNVNEKGVLQPRSILIDTETKVVKNVQKSSLKFNNIVAKSVGGSANNWAYGYTENSKLVVSEVLNAVRCELEKSDFVTSFLNFYSLSGGTGSGVGSYIIEKLRHEYPRKTIINCGVLPYNKGEISTQAYNCLLNLTKLYSIGDCTILFENERLLHLCKYTLGLNEVAFSNMNFLMSQQIASVFQPIPGVNTPSIINHLTGNPLYKFLQIRTEPNFHKQNSKFESAQQWTSLMNALMKQSRFDIQQFRNTKCGFKNKVISNVLITRGSEELPQNILKLFTEPKDLVSWLPQEESVKVYSVSSPFLSYQKYFTRFFNGNSVVVPLNSIVDDAWTSFTHGAYLHHYSNYGIDEEYFLNSFQLMENILNDYKNI